VTKILIVRMAFSVFHGASWSLFQDVRGKGKKATIIASNPTSLATLPLSAPKKERKKENSWDSLLF
jgi:hypothetical protein